MDDYNARHRGEGWLKRQVRTKFSSPELRKGVDNAGEFGVFRTYDAQMVFVGAFLLGVLMFATSGYYYLAAICLVSAMVSVTCAAVRFTANKWVRAYRASGRESAEKVPALLATDFHQPSHKLTPEENDAMLDVINSIEHATDFQLAAELVKLTHANS